MPCGANEAAVYPLLVEVFAPAEGALEGWESPGVAPYQGNHGLPTVDRDDEFAAKNAW